MQCVMNTKLELMDTRVDRTYLADSSLPSAHFKGMICERTQKDKDDVLGCMFRIHSY